MQTRFKKNAKIFDIVITAVGGTLSVGVMLYAVLYFGLGNTWPELVLNMFYIASLVFLLGGHHGAAARYSLRAAAGLSFAPSAVSFAVGAAALHAHVFLCA